MTTENTMDIKSAEPRKAMTLTRDIIVNMAKSVRTLEEKSSDLARKAGKKWEESKPNRDKAKNNIKKATEHVVDFGKDVRDGFNEGVAEVRKENKKTTDTTDSEM